MSRFVWYRRGELDQDKYERISVDCASICNTLDVEGGTWFAATLFTKRACGGDGSPEIFAMRCINKQSKFKPYDLAIQCCLIVFAHHLDEGFYIYLDDKESQWSGAKAACQAVLGYGADFRFDTKEY